MRYLLIILIFILSFTIVNGQTRPSGFPSQSNLGWQKWGWSQSDSGLIPPKRDTNFLPRFSGTMVFRPGDRRYYYYDSTDLRWYSLTQSAGDSSFVYVDYIPQASAPSYSEGRLWYDNGNNTLSFYDQISGTSLQIGQENVVYARNNTGSQINNGQVVYVTGAIGQNPTVALARSNNINTTRTLGMATHDISNNSTGKITTFGLVNDINTSSFSAGDRLYLSSSTAGALTNVVPDTPNYVLFVGFCLTSHVNQGKILVDPQKTASRIYQITDTSFVVNEDTIKIHAPSSPSSGVTSVALSMPSAFNVSGSPITTNGTFAVTGAGTSAQYIRGNGTLATLDTSAIPSFSVKVRSLFSGSSPIAYDQSSGTFSLADLTTAGACTGCNLTINSKGQIVLYSSGTGSGDTAINLGSGVGLYKEITSDTFNFKSLTEGYGIGIVNNTNDVGIEVDTNQIATQYDLTQIGGSQTWQQTLTTGSTFTTNNTINQSGFNILWTGGGQNRFDSTRHTVTYSNPVVGISGYVSFGTSITAGLNSTVQDSAYVNRAASYFGLSLTNKGVSSSVSYDAIASILSYINPGQDSLVSLETGLNDYRSYGGGNEVHNGVKNAYEAAITNQFLDSYVSASNVAVTRYGSWTTNYNAVVNSGGKTTTAAYTSVNLDSMTTTVTGTSVAVGVIGLAGNGRSCVVYIDNVKVDSFNTGGQTFATGTQYKAMGKYYVGLSSGSHQVKLVASGGSNILLVDYIGTFVATAQMKPFIIVQIPHMDATGYAGGSATQAIIDRGNDSLLAVYNRAIAAGLNVYIAHTNDYYNASTSSGLSSDHIHPNNLGHYQIFQAVRFGLSSATSLTGTIRYSNDGRFYGTDDNGILNQIPYTSDLTLQRVLTNGSNLTNPYTITGTNNLDFTGFNRVSLKNFKVREGSPQTAFMEGTLGVVGANGGLFVGNRSADTTKGFIHYTSSNLYRLFDTYNARDVMKRDTSFRVLYINNGNNILLSTPSATVHIGGNDGGVAGHASFKIDSGALMSTPEKYAIEVNGNHIYWSDRTNTRFQLDQQVASFTGVAYNSSGTLSAATIGDLLQLSGSTIDFNAVYMDNLPNNHINLKSRMHRLSYTVPDADFTSLSTRQEGWFYLPEITANRTFDLFVGSGVDGVEFLLYNLNTSGTFSWTFSGGTIVKASDTSTPVTAIPNGACYHIIGSYNGSTAKWIIVNQ